MFGRSIELVVDLSAFAAAERSAFAARQFEELPSLRN